MPKHPEFEPSTLAMGGRLPDLPGVRAHYTVKDTGTGECSGLYESVDLAVEAAVDESVEHTEIVYLEPDQLYPGPFGWKKHGIDDGTHQSVPSEI